MHYRQRIRETLAIRLAAAETLAGPNVFTSRARPILEILQKREAVLSVYTADETSVRSPDGHLLTRALTVSVEAAAGGGDDLDAILDHLAEQVEAAIDADPTLGGLLTDDLELTATTSEISARGNQQVGAFRMDFEAKYLTERGVDAALGPEPPTPTNITISGTPTPAAYVMPLDDAIASTPAIVPSTIDAQVVSPSRPPESVQSACEGGSCDVPAYTGDTA
jgi:hypothetical protein